MIQDLGKSEKVNPLDASMTRAQVVRRKFKSALPRTIRNIRLSNSEALARTIELIDRFRSEMKSAGLDPNDVSAALVFHQPETPGMEDVVMQLKQLPPPGRGKFGKFCEDVMALDRPVFLGVLFHQIDKSKGIKPEKRNTIFAYQFMSGPDAEKRLLAARQRQARGVKPAN